MPLNDISKYPAIECTMNLIDDFAGFRPHPVLHEHYKHLRILTFGVGAANSDCDGDDDVDLLRHVTIVVLDRPHKRNALHSDMWNEIGDVFSVLGRLGDDCRAVILVGNGRSFCAGIDLTDASFFPKSASSQLDAARLGVSWLPKLQHMQACFTALESCPVPVVAVIHGACVGAGIDLACCADIRLCATDAVFAVKEVTVGLAADVGALQRLPKIVGKQSMVRELCLTGRNFNATEALDMGLVSHSYPVQQLASNAMKIAIDMARHSPLAVQGTKAALVYTRDHSVTDSLSQIALYNALALQGPDIALSLQARATRENPVFPRIPPYSKL